MNFKPVLNYKFEINIFIGLIGIYIILILSNHYIAQDGVQYLSLGYNLFHSGVYNTTFGLVPGMLQSPGYPFFAGLLSLLFPIQFCGKFVGILSTIGLLISIYIFSKTYFSRKISLFAIVFLGLNPLIIFLTISSLSESLYILIHFILFLSVFLLLKNKTFSLKMIIVVSILSVLLFLTRTEGILYIPLIILILLFKRKVKEIIIYSLLISIFSLPYGLYIKNNLGKYDLAPKITFNYRIGLLQKYFLNQNETLINDPDMLVAKSWYELDTLNMELYSSNSYNDQNFLEISNEFEPINNNSLNQLRNVLLVNFDEIIRIFIRSNAFPIVFALLIIIGIYIILFVHKRRHIFNLVFLWMVPVFYFIPFHVNERFFLPFLPYFSIIAAIGSISIYERFKQKRYILNIIIVLFLINVVNHYREIAGYIKSEDNNYYISQNISNIVPKDETISNSNPLITFYSKHNYCKLPITDIPHLYKYFKKNKVSYFLLGKDTFTYRREFIPIFLNNESQRFKLIKDYIFENETIKLFKVL